MIGKTAIWQNSILDIMVPRIMHPANVLVDVYKRQILVFVPIVFDETLPTPNGMLA